MTIPWLVIHKGESQSELIQQSEVPVKKDVAYIQGILTGGCRKGEIFCFSPIAKFRHNCHFQSVIEVMN